MSQWAYFDELRTRLWRVVGVFLIVFLFSCYFYGNILEFILMPIRHAMPSASQMITTSLVDLVVTPLHFSMWLAVLVSWPYLLVQIWYFFAPAMYPSERRMIALWLGLSSLMLWLGLLAGALLLLPQMIKAMLSYMPTSILFLPDIRLYIQFALECCFAIGFVSQFPVLLWLGLYLKWISWQQLLMARRYVIVLSLVVGMLLTPPDVVSQLLVAVPMWLLYECTLIVGWLFQRKIKQKHIKNEP